MDVEKMKGSISSDWLSRLSPFIESKEFDAIANYVAAARKSSVVCPSKGDTFKALNLCTYDDLKVVMAAQDPYHSVSNSICVADGLAFSCSYTKYPQPSLKQIAREIVGTTGSKTMEEKGYDLTYLATQGVLLINKSLTVSHGKANSHQGIWDKFHDALFTEIKKKSSPIIYLLLGNDSIRYFSTHARPMYDIVITAKHPASAVYSGGIWDSMDCFNQTNEALKTIGKTEIYW